MWKTSFFHHEMMWYANVRGGADLKNKHICPEGSYGLFLTCGKKMGSVIYTYTHNCYDHYSSCTKFTSLHILLHTWEAKRCQHCSEWVHPCSSLKADWVFSLTTWDRTPNNFPTMAFCSLAILSLACPDITADRCLNSNTYKSQRYTSRLKQWKAQCYS
jgi:hypothetical protein